MTKREKRMVLILALGGAIAVLLTVLLSKFPFPRPLSGRLAMMRNHPAIAAWILIALMLSPLVGWVIYEKIRNALGRSRPT
jgi:Zn-dependent protease with chaperone function